MKMISKLQSLRVAIKEFEVLLIEIKGKGTPPHADYWHQSIHEAEMKVKEAYEGLGIR